VLSTSGTIRQQKWSFAHKITYAPLLSKVGTLELDCSRRFEELDGMTGDAASGTVGALRSALFPSFSKGKGGSNGVLDREHGSLCGARATCEDFTDVRYLTGCSPFASSLKSEFCGRKCSANSKS